MPFLSESILPSYVLTNVLKLCCFYAKRQNWLYLSSTTFFFSNPFYKAYVVSIHSLIFSFPEKNVIYLFSVLCKLMLAGFCFNEGQSYVKGGMVVICLSVLLRRAGISDWRCFRESLKITFKDSQIFINSSSSMFK